MQRDLNGDGRGPIRGGGPDRVHPPRHFFPHRSLLIVYFGEKAGLNLNTRKTKFNSSLRYPYFRQTRRFACIINPR